MLKGIEVLELVDVDVAPAPALGAGEFGITLQSLGRPEKEVVKVDQAPAALLSS